VAINVRRNDVRRVPRGLRLWGWAVTVGVAACLGAPPTGPLDEPGAASDAAFVRTWTVILRVDSGPDSGAIAIAQTDRDELAGGVSEYHARARLWTVLDGAPADSELTLDLTLADGSVGWRLTRDATPVAWGGTALPLFQRVRRTEGAQWLPPARGGGRGTWTGTNVPVSFAALADVPMPQQPLVDPMPVGSVTLHAHGIVSLRVDDCSALDSATFGVLRELHLVAEFGVPSRFVGRPGRCSLSLLRALVAAGNTIESHSRHHWLPPKDFAQFYLETVGSARDLRVLGFEPHVFVQPGSWNKGEFYLNSLTKVLGPAGMLLRRLYVATEAYAYSATNMALPAPGRLGPAARVLRTLTPADIEMHVRRAAAGGSWIQFMWHSSDIPADSLRPRLAVIAALRDSGLVEVMPFYRALHAAAPSPVIAR
jgi:hypothetical protein